ASVLATVFDDSLRLQSIALAAELRRAGLNVSVYPEPAKLPKQFKYADKMKMKAAVTIGPDEAAQNQVAVKDLTSGEQVVVARADVVDAVRRLL
ncbi:MAG: hypothetical protein KJZ57_15360, partial [Anaerolineales bacterium]|nr:hypothetical protein [Anaerolineales bacterium]